MRLYSIGLFIYLRSHNPMLVIARLRNLVRARHSYERANGMLDLFVVAPYLTPLDIFEHTVTNIDTENIDVSRFFVRKEKCKHRP